jgi:transposase
VFKPHVQDQGELFPPRVGDLIPDDDLVRVVSEVVDQLDLTAFAHNYSHLGQNAFNPRTMLKLTLYGYAVGVRSSREIAAAIQDRVRFMWIAGNDKPGKSAIADFRKRNAGCIEDIFIQVVLICSQLGMVKFGLWSIDGTKLKANAGKNGLRTKDAMEEEITRLRAEIRAAMEEAEQADDEPDDEPPLPPSIRRKQDREKRLEQALKTTEDNPKASPKTKANTTDPDAKLMQRKGGGFEPAYSPQITVDSESQVVLAADVCTDTTDVLQLIPQIDQAISNTGGKPDAVAADAGYYSGPNLAAVKERDIAGYVAEKLDTNRKQGQFKREDFQYDEATDSFICPAGKTLSRGQIKTKQRKSGNFKAQVYKCNECAGCELASRCLKKKAKSRSIEVSEHEGVMKELHERLLTEQGKAALAQRRQSVEPVYGVQKTVMRFREFLLRGLKYVRAEFKLAMTAFNLRKIFSYLHPRPKPGAKPGAKLKTA